eukprot:CAMPEP_0183747990 /NCGR_PEP_ID=MMETSP0737-20130205/67540_1 /TAXON_ID=385413 /ORGANISM="Thalassiosira miniscula, Strain CCMP1093" /LENGTH=340 /DNA_ID=CAMNT_0025983707 /DNA_START=245 /DNA_END=1267 /DNA_ORIENTATION=+
MTNNRQVPALFKIHQQRLKYAILRDVMFLLAGAIAYAIVAYVETHASDDEIRVIYRSSSPSSLIPNNDDAVCSIENEESCLYTPSKTGILDAGFILTAPIHSYLACHRNINDLLAMWNSMMLTIPLAYVIYVTLWKGDFRLSFRLIATHLFRTFCGWLTYLPPDPEFLSSLYDFPEIFLCLFQECSSHSDQVVNFLTFFSGHVATIVIIANHLYMAKHTRLSVCLHCFNWLQAIRLLATRGHYSIDLIIGYVVAAFVSSPAERLGLYYSRGIQPVLPGFVEAFENLTGVSMVENQEDKSNTTSQMSSLNGMSSHDDLNNVQSDTSVRIAVDIVANIALRE